MWLVRVMDFPKRHKRWLGATWTRIRISAWNAIRRTRGRIILRIVMSPRCPMRSGGCPVAFDGSSESTQFTDAIYAGGVLRPLNGLLLRENEHVHLLVSRSQTPSAEERRAALQRL